MTGGSQETARTIESNPAEESVSRRQRPLKLLLAKLDALIRNAGSKGVFHLFGANLTIGLLAFGAQLLVVKFLTPAEMGYAKTLQSFMAIATLVAGFGFNTAVVKLCSEKITSGARAYIFRKCFQYTLIPIAATLLVLFLAARQEWLSPIAAVNEWMPLYMWMIPGFVLTAIAVVYLQATRQIKTMATTQTVTRLIGAAILVLAAFAYSFPGFVAATVVVNILALVPLLWILRRDLRSREVVPQTLPRSMYFARWGLAANVIQTIGANVDILMLNYFWPDRDDLGYYGIATILLLGLNQITGTIQSIATPYFSEKSGDRNESWRVLKKYQSSMIVVAALAATGAIAVVPGLVNWLYGTQYATVGDYFRILAVKYFLWSCYALSAVALLGAGRMRLYTLAVSVSAIVTLVLSGLVVTGWGPTGVAVAQVVGSLITLIVVSLLIRRVYRSSSLQT